MRLPLTCAAIGAIFLLGATGLEAKSKPKLPPPAAPTPARFIPPPPPRPVPPLGASPLLILPPLRPNGLFQSVDREISPAQIIWNLRSAYNVGALDCNGPERDQITANYRAFLRKHRLGLAKANRQVDAEFRATYGTRYILSREKFMTGVYNHFALPPTLPNFCVALLAVSHDAQTIKLTELSAFSARSLPSLEIVFDDFYKKYAQYQSDAADWDARYGVVKGAIQPVNGPR